MNKKEEIVAGITERKDKSLRTLRNNLNNRISSFEHSDKFGKSLKELKESHPLSAFSKKDCKEILELVQKEMRQRLK